MDEYGMNELSFRVFARTMSVLSDKAFINEKCKISFGLYDLNNDKVIDANKLREIINDLLMSATRFMDPLLIKLITQNEENIYILINNTMKQFDLDINGNISYNSYRFNPPNETTMRTLIDVIGSNAFNWISVINNTIF